jgi:hypothetical protein
MAVKTGMDVDEGTGASFPEGIPNVPDSDPGTDLAYSLAKEAQAIVNSVHGESRAVRSPMTKSGG